MSFEQIDLQWFAAEDEGRTEQPSELKLRKAREEGRVAKSQELNSSLVLLACVVVLLFIAPYCLKWCEEILIYYFQRCTEQEITKREFFITFLINMAKMVLPFTICGTIAGFSANLIQTRGFMFSLKPIEIKFSNVVPHIGQYLKKTVFSPEGLFNVVKSIFKVAAVIIIAFVIIRKNLPLILSFLNAPSVRLSVGKIAGIAAQILIVCSLLFLAISIPDYFVNRHQFIESLKMTKQEVKQEFKETEGDPQVKGKLKQAQRQLLQQNLPKAVAESDVVITNPTHISVALKWDRNIADRPMVNAKGEDLIAKRIRDLADEHGVPRVENVPLARGLYAQTEVGDIIPDDYLKAIAIIYAHTGKFGK